MAHELAAAQDLKTRPPAEASGARAAAVYRDFTRRERDELDLCGLVPPAVCTIQQQMERTYANFKAKTSNLEKSIWLTSLQDRNETLFYRLVLEHIDEMMPIAYTPVVGEACPRYSHIYGRGRGLHVAYEERDRIETILTDPGIKNRR